MIFKKYICENLYNNQRIDVFLSKITSLSRNKISKFIEFNQILKNNLIVKKPNLKVFENDVIEIIELKNEKEKPNELNIKIIYENENFLAINKPPFISVHDTILNDKKYNLTDWIKDNNFWNDKENDPFENRYGLVHRLDKGTSGIVLIAKNLKYLNILKDLFKKRLIEKEYIAFVIGKIENEKNIKTKIIRNPLKPTEMTVSLNQGKDSETNYKKIEDKKDFSIISCFPKTGRMHQIRVHLKSIGIFIIGDDVYGKNYSEIKRPALHAKSLKFKIDEIDYFIEADLYFDMQNLIKNN